MVTDIDTSLHVPLQKEPVKREILFFNVTDFLFRMIHLWKTDVSVLSTDVSSEYPKRRSLDLTHQDYL